MREPSDIARPNPIVWLVVGILAALGLLAGCGSDDEPTPGAADAVATPGSTGTEGTTGGGDATSASTAGDRGATTAGNGVILADFCAGGQPVNGAISLDDLVQFGLLASAAATVEGSGTYDAVAYRDFGFICNIDAADDGDYVTLQLSPGRRFFDDAAGRDGAVVEAVGDWQAAYQSGLTPLLMLHVDADGTEDTLIVTWLPADDTRRTDPVEIERVMRPFAEAVAETTFDVPRLDAPAVPAWFVCDDANGGVAGVAPEDLSRAAGGRAEVAVEVAQDITASFGYTDCAVAPVTGFLPVTRVRVQDSDEELQDTVASYLAGWDDARAETIAGVDAAVRLDGADAYVFAVVDGVPLEIRLGTDGNDDGTVGARILAVAEMVLAAAA